MLHVTSCSSICLFLQIFFCTRTIITFSLEHLFVFVVFALTQFCFLFLFLLENFFLVWLCFNTYTHTQHSHPHSQTKRNFNMLLLFYFLSFVSYFVILFISLVFLLFLKQLLDLYIAIVLQLQHCCLFNLLTHTHTIKRFLHPPPRRRRSRSTSSFFVFNGQLIYSTVTKHTRVLFDSFIR